MLSLVDLKLFEVVNYSIDKRDLKSKQTMWADGLGRS